jgi:hypothetical protein
VSELIGLKEQVERAVAEEWKAFEAEHPRLAAVIDQTTLVQGAVTALSEDPEYIDTLAESQAAGIAMDAVGGLIRRFAGKWVRELIG